MENKAVIDPEFESLISPLTAEEYAALEESILAEGCRQPVVTWNGILIDGHHRRKICKKHNKPYRTVKKRFASREEALIWAIDTQLTRRNLSDYERGALALKKKDMIAKQAKARQHAGVNQHTKSLPQISAEPAIETRQAIASMAQLSHDSITKIAKIEARAEPAIIAAARSKAITINAASKLAALPRDEQQAITAAGEEAIVKAAKKIVKQVKRTPDADTTETSGVAVESGAVAVESGADATVDDDVLAETEKQLHVQIAKVQAENIKLSDALASLRTKYADLEAHCEEVEADACATLADNDMMRRTFEAHPNDQVKIAMEEAVRQKSIADVATRSYNEQQGKVKALNDQVKYWKRRAEKAEKMPKARA